jgi:hypothetical protein
VVNTHHCHWPGCQQPVPPRFWGCHRHWNMLPAKLRGWIMATFRPGQEVTKEPTPDYIRAACAARNWAKKNPDPELPPFEPGQIVRGKPGTLFAQTDMRVVGLTLVKHPAGGKQWTVEVAGGGSFPALELVRINGEVS